MEKYFGDSYKGDPGVPHTHSGVWWDIWIASALYGVYTFVNPYQWYIANTFNYHDRAMIFEQHNWRKAMKRNDPYEFEWNKMNTELRTSYYFNENTYFK